MASERQIAANRRNGRNSSGPRSAAGKKRASQNAYRHGLASAIPLGQRLAGEIERLAHKMLAGRDGLIALACARSAAEASLELARVRHAKVALVGAIAAVGAQDPHPARDPIAEAFDRDLTGPRNRGLKTSDGATPSRPPPQELEPHDEALRRALPELMKLDRYERRAASRRARALRFLFYFKLRD